MKILILGGDGMLGHQLLKELQTEHDVRVTLKEEHVTYQDSSLFHADNTFYGVNLLDDYSLLSAILEYRPDVIVNASGVIKYRSKSQDKIYSLKINSLLPHRIAEVAKQLNIRLITFSTDCVFSGKKGNYTEQDPSDAEDIYGQTKFAGEISDEAHCLTLRTSFFGLELKHYTGLIEWFLSAKGTISGYTKAIYSGLTTFEMARIIKRVINDHPALHGLYHVAADPIDKFHLLTQLQKNLNRQDIEIKPDHSFVMDRSLNASQFKQITGYQSPSWAAMLSELAQAIKIRELA